MQNGIGSFDNSAQRVGTQRRRTFGRVVQRAVFLGVCLFLALTTRAEALEIDETIWGFDGRITPDCFNPLSILVSNRTPNIFDGTLTLHQSLGSNSVDAKLVESVYLSPNSTRWVQFYPYVKYGHENWTVRTSARERLDITNPMTGDRAPVFLSDPDNFLQTGTALKRFPDNLFPPLVGATDGLKAVVLDHIPRWEESRRRSFLDWLHRGGTVHLVKSSTGDYPEFPPALSELNLQLPQFRVGSGKVYRHTRSARELDKKFVDRIASGNFDDSPEALPDDIEGVKSGRDAVKAGGNNAQEVLQQQFDDRMFYDLPSNFFEQLKQMTKPDHAWAVIYLMSLGYIALIFPGFYILGLKRRDYRFIYGAMLLVIAIFSFAFAQVGRRGYDETTTMNTVALARPVSEGSLDVTGWTDAFVTDGDDYVIDYPGGGKIFSTCQQVEAVNGVITSGSSGQFVVDIPPYSSRSFVYRERVEGGPTPKVVAFTEGNQVDKLEVSLGDAFAGASILNGLALRKDKLYNVAFNNGLVQLTAGNISMGDLATKFNQHEFGGMGGRFYPFQDEKPSNQRYNDMFWPLIIRSFDYNSQKKFQDFVLPNDRIRLFLYAPLPESLQGSLKILEGSGEEQANQTGRVLYVLDVFPGEKS